MMIETLHTTHIILGLILMIRSLKLHSVTGMYKRVIDVVKWVKLSDVLIVILTRQFITWHGQP